MFTTFILVRNGQHSTVRGLYRMFVTMGKTPDMDLHLTVSLLWDEFSGVILYTDKPVTDMVTEIVKTCFDRKNFRVYKWPKKKSKDEIWDYLKSQSQE